LGTYAAGRLLTRFSTLRDCCVRRFLTKTLDS
jgi:hypothetical protein